MGASDVLKTTRNENSKSWFVYDELARVIEVYEGRANMKAGDACQKTTYTYVGATGRVQRRVETDSTWRAEFDA